MANPWEIIGSGLRQTGADLGAYGQRRMAFDEMVQRRLEAMRQAREAEERKALQEREDKRQQEEHDRRMNAKPGWEPSTPEEKLEYERRLAEIKADIAAKNKKPPAPSADDKRRLMERDNARKLLPATWMALDKVWGQKPKAPEPLSGTAKDYVEPEFAKTEDDWHRRMEATKKRIQDLQVQAGESVTSDPFSTEREQSPSWLEYAQSAYPGKYPAYPGGRSAPAQPPPTASDADAPASDSDSDIQAFLSRNGFKVDAQNIETVRKRMRGAL